MDKLGLYNLALHHLGERRIMTLNENQESRRVLDHAWDGVRDRCLEEGQWNFATRAVELASTPSIDPAFGYQHAFTKPEDWVRTVGMSDGPEFRRDVPADVLDENGLWWADFDPIFVRYISKDAQYGHDISRWPQSYVDYVAHELAFQCCIRITGSKEKKDSIEKDLKRAKNSALAKDAMNNPTQFIAPGSWATSRSGGTNWRRRTKGY